MLSGLVLLLLSHFCTGMPRHPDGCLLDMEVGSDFCDRSMLSVFLFVSPTRYKS